MRRMNLGMTPDLALVKPDDFEPVRACCSRKGDVL